MSATIKLEAETDFLTGLYNRRYLIQSLYRFIEQANLNDTLIFSLFMLDIDHFKEINDQFGHEAGDDVLQQIAQIMLKNTRSEEKISRFGGEEFVGFLPELVEKEAEMIAERIRKQIFDHIFLIGSQNIKVTVSIGVSQWNVNNNDDVQSLLKRIDKALYKAKGNGRNCTVVL
ncbi:GGDEF domain-containing protein [Desulfosporosinus sp. BICA1-9]|uniref:GGDEF domain-containing protein n=1 Tax=Desulfosporosinus sp. BICA1-9 TaxID=1531958 RepID=UPI0034540F91